MISSLYHTFQDNSSHGEDSFLVKDLGQNSFLDVVLDGVTGHGGGEASQNVAQALSDSTITSMDDVIEILLFSFALNVSVYRTTFNFTHN